MGSKSASAQTTNANTTVETKNLSMADSTAFMLEGSGNSLSITDSGATAAALEANKAVSLAASQSMQKTAGDAFEFGAYALRETTDLASFSLDYSRKSQAEALDYSRATTFKALDHSKDANDNSLLTVAKALDFARGSNAEAMTMSEKATRGAMSMVQSAFTDDGAETVQAVTKYMAIAAAVVAVAYVVYQGAK